MTDDLERVMQVLRQEYLAEAPARLAELRKDSAAFRAGEADATSSLRMRFHRLAGSGGSYGFPGISEIAREAEVWLKGDPPLTEENAARIDEAIRRLARTLDDAVAGATKAAEAGSSPRGAADFGLTALVIARESALRDTMVEALHSSGFSVTTAGGTDHREVPLTETPDLVVISGSAEDGIEPYATASAWSGRRLIRPRGIVLVDPSSATDRIRAVSAGIDTVFTTDRVQYDLAQYAKTLARIGAPPSSVLLVMEDRAHAAEITGWMETANIRVTRCDDPLLAREQLARDLPDLVLLDTNLTRIDAFTLARLMRQDMRFALLPMVFLANERTVKDQIEALRAGADHFLTKPLDHDLLIQLVVNRAERGRRIREMVHRDGLTGLLNHATLMAELEHAVEYARRHGESFAFLMIDVDHFKRVNDTHGHLAGDQVLLHLARVFLASVRASDLIGRYGGEEFGMILPRSTREGALTLATKLREALAGRPAVTRDGVVIPVRISVGIACYPQDAATAGALTAAADRALYRAKSSGRDRIEMHEEGS